IGSLLGVFFALVFGRGVPDKFAEFCLGKKRTPARMDQARPISTPKVSLARGREAQPTQTYYEPQASPGEQGEQPVHAWTGHSAAPADETLAVPGYEILGVLARGGMGVVYRARQVAANRLVALKMILASSHAGPEQRARFRREAQAVARL